MLTFYATCSRQNGQGTPRRNFWQQAMIEPGPYAVGALCAWISVPLAFLVYLIRTLFYIVPPAGKTAEGEVPTAFFKEIDPLVVDSPAYHDILIDGLGGGDLRGKRATPALLVRRLVAAQPVRVL
ncbi:MAG: hypothetical protein HS103_12665 [Anaerolineales bacterium]|nr:hypothetical protein [Anaerolineales bacterium]